MKDPVGKVVNWGFEAGRASVVPFLHAAEFERVVIKSQAEPAQVRTHELPTP